MDANNLQILVNLSGGSGDRLRQGLRQSRRARTRIDGDLRQRRLERRGTPGWAAKAAAQLEADIKAGAKGLKVFKDLGLRITKADGTRLKLDDPELAPIWEVPGRMGVPVLIHTAEPQEFSKSSITATSAGWRWRSTAIVATPKASSPASRSCWPSAIACSRRIRKTKFIAAHFGYRANDLAKAAKMLDTMPNVYLEVAAILANSDVSRAPRTNSSSSTRTASCSAKTAISPTSIRITGACSRPHDEYFDYYRDYHAFWKLYGMGLPDEVLKKLYYKNALTLVPGLPRKIPELMTSFLVTGGAGFIGSHLVEELLRRSTACVGSTISPPERANVAAATACAVGDRWSLARRQQPGARCRGGRIRPRRSRRHRRRAGALSTACDIVLHQAAIPSVPRSMKDPLTSHRANVDATFNMLRRGARRRVRRIVFAGSSSEYGDTPTLPKHEEMPLQPLSPYALQKVIGEQYLQQFTRFYGLETVSIRYFNVFGPRQDPASPYSGVISLFITALLEGRRRRSTATASRPATSPTSPTSSMACCGRRRRRASAARSSTSPPAAASRSISCSHALQRIIGTDISRSSAPSRSGDVRDSQADIRKAERLLGYKPRSASRGLRRTVEWYRSERRR